MPARVQRLDHPLELADLLAARAGRGVQRVRREVADRAVAPVVGQPALDEEALVDDVVHRQQLDRGDAELAQVGDRGLARPRRRCRAGPRGSPRCTLVKPLTCVS